MKDLLKDIKTAFKWIVIGIVLLVLVFALVEVFPLTPDSLRYSMYYNTESKNVYVGKRPTDCDWGHAPLGDKACHYEKKVTPYYDQNGHVREVDVVWEKVQD